MTLSGAGPALKTSFRLTQQMSDTVSTLAAQWGCTPSDVIRYGLDLATDPVALGAAVAVALAEFKTVAPS